MTDFAAAAALGQSVGSLGDAQSAQAQAALKIKAKAKSASEQFEAMFLNSMFQQMFTKMDGDGPFGGSGALKVWRSFLTDQYAKTFRQEWRHRHRLARLRPIAQAARSEGLMTAITTTAEAEKAIAQVADLIDKLRGVVEQETALVHAGKVRNAATLGPAKKRT